MTDKIKLGSMAPLSVHQDSKERESKRQADDSKKLRNPFATLTLDEDSTILSLKYLYDRKYDSMALISI